MRRFTRQPRPGAGKGRAYGCDEFIPRRGPLHQQPRSLIKLDDLDLVELKNFGQVRSKSLSVKAAMLIGAGVGDKD